MNFLLTSILLAFIGFTFAEACSEGEGHTFCGSACPTTCADQRANIPCTLQCVRGMFCYEPYVRNQFGKCVLREQCPDHCNGLNEFFMECGTACPKTCANMNLPEQPCTKQCVKGCFCDGFHVKDETNGKCVLPKECPLKTVNP